MIWQGDMNRRLLRVLAIIISAWVIWSLLTVVLIQRSVASDYGGSILSIKDEPKYLGSVKLSTKIDGPKSVNTHGNATAGFVHIGKTGGSNLARLLMNGCHSFKPKPCKLSVPNETIVSKLVQDYYHIVDDTAKIQDSNHTIYIVTTRDPFDRTVSSFVYMHPRNKATFKRHMSLEDMLRKNSAYKCFKTLESFTQFIGDEPNDFAYPNPHLITKKNCTILARAIVAGRVDALEHMYNNYYNVLRWIPPGRDVYIVRQEHIWDDWIRVNRMLGQEQSIVLPQERVRRNVTTNSKPPVTKDLSTTGSHRLCKALIREYEALFKIMHQAKNMGNDDIKQSVEAGRRRCPNIGMHALAFENSTR